MSTVRPTVHSLPIPLCKHVLDILPSPELPEEDIPVYVEPPISSGNA